MTKTRKTTIKWRFKKWFAVVVFGWLTGVVNLIRVTRCFYL